MTDATEILRVLAVGCHVSGEPLQAAVVEVGSAVLALAALRRDAFDLLLTPMLIGEEPVWSFLRDVRRVRPKLRWWLVAHGITPDQEVLARTLRVTRIVPGPMTCDQLLGPPSHWVAGRTLPPPLPSPPNPAALSN